MSRPERTQKQIRTAARRRGDIAGHLGLTELAALTAQPTIVGECDSCGYRIISPELVGHWCGRTIWVTTVVPKSPVERQCPGTFRPYIQQSGISGEFEVKSVEFCYWLQGMFELSSPKTLDERQTDLIKRHLAMVFTHEIDQSYPANQHAALNAIHSKPTPIATQDNDQTPTGVLYRC